MGGLGSGREAWVYNGIVEDSLQLDVNKLVTDRVISRYCQASGILSWKRSIFSTSSIGYETQCYIKNGYMRLIYKVSSLAVGEQAINYTIDLFTTRPYFGSIRWWFVCPNPDCDRMVAKLYQPPGATHFLCRTCHNLTYASCRESGKYDSLYKHMAAETGLSMKEVKRAYRLLFG